MLKIIDISLKRNQVPLFEHASLTVHAGQKVALVGRNGVGKSTLFDLVLGAAGRRGLQPDSGDVELPGDWRISHMAQEVEVSDRIAIDYVIDGHRELRKAEQALARAEAAGDDEAAADGLDIVDALAVESPGDHGHAIPAHRTPKPPPPYCRGRGRPAH